MPEISLQPILEPISNYQKTVDGIINETLTTGIPLVDDSGLHLFRKGGKKIRAALVLLVSGLRSVVPQGAAEIAAAVEIVHAATLVHDDIIDRSFLRRGTNTVSQEWGNKVAVLSGDHMYTTGLDLVVQDGDPRLFPVIVKATKDMVQGELYQLQYSNFDAINREHYNNIIELKTARFMAACSCLGALKAGFSDDECSKMYDFGLKLGIAFQISDDVLEYLTVETTGKDIGNDYRDGKITLPAIHMLEQVSVEKREEIRDLYTNPSEDNWQILCHRIKEAGGIEETVQTAEKYVKDAVNLLADFPDSEYKNILVGISQFFINREY